MVILNCIIVYIFNYSGQHNKFYFFNKKILNSYEKNNIIYFTNN